MTVSNLSQDNPRLFSANLPKQPGKTDDVKQLEQIKSAAQRLLDRMGKVGAESMDKIFTLSDTTQRTSSPEGLSYGQRPVTTRELVKRLKSNGLDRSK